MSRRGRPCSICCDARRSDIDSSLLAGVSLASVARSFAVDRFAIGRHARAHTERQRAKKERISEQRERIASVSTSAPVRFSSPGVVIEQTEALYGQIQALLAHAKETNDQRLALAAIREAKDVLANFARMHGLFKDETPIATSHETRILNVIGAQSEETLRAFLAGDLSALPPAG